MEQTSGSVLREFLDQVNQDRRLAINMGDIIPGLGSWTAHKDPGEQSRPLSSLLLPDYRCSVTSCGQAFPTEMFTPALLAKTHPPFLNLPSPQQ